MKFLSWDCANKTLGRIYLELDFDIFAIEFTNLDQLRAALDGFVREMQVDVIDLCPGQKIRDVSPADRARRLATTLREKVVPADTIVIIEHQPDKIGPGAINVSSPAVAHQLLYHYIDHAPKLVNPALKRNICLGSGLEYQRFYEAALKRHKTKRAARYAANKEHSKANFLYFLKAFGLGDRAAHIPRAVLDDAADSCMLIFAYLGSASSW